MPRKTKPKSQGQTTMRRSSRIKLNEKAKDALNVGVVDAEINVVEKKIAKRKGKTMNDENENENGNGHENGTKNGYATGATPEVLRQVRKKGDGNRVEKKKVGARANKKGKNVGEGLVIGLEENLDVEPVEPLAPPLTTTAEAGQKPKSKTSKAKAPTKAAEKKTSAPPTSQNKKKEKKNQKETSKEAGDGEGEFNQIKFVPVYSDRDLHAQRKAYRKKNGLLEDDELGEESDPEDAPHVDRYFAKRNSKKKKSGEAEEEILISEGGYKLLKKMYAEVDKRTPGRQEIIWMIRDDDGYEVYEVMEKKLKEYVKFLRCADTIEPDVFKLYPIVEALAFFLDGEEDRIWQTTDDGERCSDFLNTAGSLFTDILTRLQLQGYLCPDLSKTPFKNFGVLVGTMLSIAQDWEYDLNWTPIILKIVREQGIVEMVRNAKGPGGEELLQAVEEEEFGDDEEEDVDEGVLVTVGRYRWGYGPPTAPWGEDLWYETDERRKRVKYIVRV